MRNPFSGTEGSRPRIIAVVVAALLALISLPLARAALDGDGSQTTSATTDATADSSASTEAGGGGGKVNNEVVVFNVTDGRFAHRAGFGTARVTGGDVTNTNSAAATSSCNDCRTVAVAVQAVLVMGDSHSIAPRNQAVAINNNCLRCESYALAYQYVVSTRGIVRFTAEGEQRLAELQRHITELAASDLGFLELEAQIDSLVEQMWAVVDEEVVRVGLRPQGTPSKDSDQAVDDSTASPTPSESPSSSPSPASSPGSSPSPTSSPSPSATPMNEPATAESPSPSG